VVLTGYIGYKYFRHFAIPGLFFRGFALDTTSAHRRYANDWQAFQLELSNLAKPVLYSFIAGLIFTGAEKA